MAPHQFRIGDDVFSAPAVLSPVVIKKLAADIGELQALGSDPASMIANIDKMLDVVSRVFRALMPGASGKLFSDRLNADGEEGSPVPIGLLDQAMPALNYLLECYGMRPTEPSLPSPDGSAETSTDTPSDGISSAVGV